MSHIHWLLIQLKTVLYILSMVIFHPRLRVIWIKYQFEIIRSQGSFGSSFRDLKTQPADDQTGEDKEDQDRGRTVTEITHGQHYDMPVGTLNTRFRSWSLIKWGSFSWLCAIKPLHNTVGLKVQRSCLGVHNSKQLTEIFDFSSNFGNKQLDLKFF